VAAVAVVVTLNPEGQITLKLRGEIGSSRLSSRSNSSYCFAEAFGKGLEKKLSTTALSQQQPLAYMLQTIPRILSRSR
jgi:hypothetical protein